MPNASDPPNKSQDVFSILIQPAEHLGANPKCMKNTSRTLFAIVGALALCACDSKEENAREDALERKADAKEDQADAVRNNAERQADALESQKSPSNASSTNSQLENAADAKRDSAETTADRLEREANAAREKK